jgi:hypothetical protein
MAGQYRFKDSNGNIVAQISASVEGAIAFSGSVVDFTQANNVILGNVQLAGTASNALLLDGFDSQAFAFTSSIHPFTASIAGTNTFTSSASTRLNSIETITASNISRLNSLEIKTGSLATTGSNTFIGTQTITGSLFISSDLIVQGSSSLQNITASAVSIGTNIVNLNTANPAIRYAGLSIGDSGSIGSSGSFLYDSVQDEMIFIHRGANTTVTSSVVLMGPQTFDSIGNETYPTTNRIQKGTGNEHLVDSCITDSGTLVTINSATQINSSITGCGAISTSGTGTNASLRINNTTSVTGKDWHSYSLNNGNFGFYNNTDGCYAYQITPSGNVGIGTNCPTNKLTISNDGNSVVAFRINDTNANASFLSFNTSNTDSAIIAGGTSAIPFDIYTGGSIRMRITCTGNVGIGTCVPFSNAKLQVNVGTNMNVAVQPGTFDCTGIKINTFVDSGASNIPLELNGNILHLKTCENVRMTINGIGNVCFACQVCAPSLEITSANINVYPRVNRSSTTNEAGWKLSTGGTDSWYTGLRSADGVGSYHFYSYTTNTSVVSITCTGRVGIGTSTPDYPLHIYCCNQTGLKIQTCGSTFGSPSINLLNGGVDTVLTATNTALEIGTWSANDIIFRTTQVERMRINTSGIVTMPFQPSMFAQPGATSFTVGSGSHAYGWCTSGSVRYNCGFTLTGATTAGTNVADAGATGKIIIPATGKYLLQFSQRNEGQVCSDGQFMLWVNGTQRIRRHIELWNGKPYIHVDVTAVLSLGINDTLEMGAWFNNARTDTFSGTGDQVNWLSLAKIS